MNKIMNKVVLILYIVISIVVATVIPIHSSIVTKPDKKRHGHLHKVNVMYATCAIVWPAFVLLHWLFQTPFLSHAVPPHP